jgi:hypothetical protein
MLRGLLLSCALAGAPLVHAACAAPGDGDGEEELDEGGSGKADNASATSTSEPLVLETMQRIACEAVAMNTVFATDAERTALMDRCQDLEFTVTQKTTSELYDHADSRMPVTLEMNVVIADGGSELPARLFRVYSLEQQRFVWRGDSPAPIDDAAYLGELAKGGAAALTNHPLWSFRLDAVDWDDLPVRVSRAVETTRAQVGGQLGAIPLAVRRDDRAAGWVAPLTVADSIVNVYLATDGTVVATDPADAL